MAYIGNIPAKGENNSFKLLDNIKTYTETFDGSSSSVINNSADSINVNNHRFIQGQRVVYSSNGGTVITGLTDNTAYYIIKEDRNNFKLATSASNANNGTVIAIAPAGSTTNHKLTVGFDAINTKFLASYDGGTKAQITRSAQLNISINGVVQEPQDTTSPTAGFGHDVGSVIIFSTAPDGNDSFWGNIVANNFPTFDQSDNKIDNFTGDNTTTDFTLSRTPPDNRNILVTLDGVTQHPSDSSTTRAYTVSENVLSFTSAPASLVSIQVRHIGFAGAGAVGGGGGGGVTSVYGRTGAVVLKSTDNPTVGNVSAGGWLSVGSTATFDNNVTIKGVLTYDDVTIVDAVGFSTFREGLRVKDNKKILFGDLAAGDLQIFHQTSDSSAVIKNENDTGFLRILSGDADSSGFLLKNRDDDVTYLRAKNEAAIELFAANSKKLETSGDGVEISGVTTSTKRIDIDAGGLNVTAGISTFDGAIDANSTLDVLNTSNFQNDVTFVGAGSSDAIWLKDSARFKLKDNAQIVFGNGQDLEIWHNSTDSFVKTTTGDMYLQSTADDVIVRAADNISLQVQGGENGIDIAGNAGVKLFYDASVHTNAKLETTGGGISVTGIVTATSFNGAGISSSISYPNLRPTLDLNFAAVKKLDPRITYYRSGPASYVDEFGIVKFVGDNAPRLDHDFITRESKGLLIEEARTNFMIYSHGDGFKSQGDDSNFTSGWVQQDTSNSTLTQFAAEGPDGTTSALKYTLSATTGRRFDYEGISVTNGTVYCWSWWMKRLHSGSVWTFQNVGGTAVTNGAVFIDGVDSGATSLYTPTDDEWHRVTWRFTAGATATQDFGGYDSSGNTGDRWLLWGAQFEVGSYATSLIPTNGSTATRGASVVTIEGEEFTDFYNQTEGTLVLSASYTEDIRTSAAVVIDDTSNESEYTEIGYRAGGGSSGAVGSYTRTDAGNDQYFKQYASSATAGSEFKVAFAYKDNDYASSVNGQTVDTDTSGTTSKVFDRLRFSDVDTVGVVGSGYYRRFIYYPKRLSNSQVVGLTA